MDAKCLEAESSCEDQRGFSTPRIGVPDQKIALHVNVHFYTDKELMVSMKRCNERQRELFTKTYLLPGQQPCRLSESL